MRNSLAQVIILVIIAESKVLGFCPSVSLSKFCDRNNVVYSSRLSRLNSHPLISSRKPINLIMSAGRIAPITESSSLGVLGEICMILTQSALITSTIILLQRAPNALHVAHVARSVSLSSVSDAKSSLDTTNLQSAVYNGRVRIRSRRRS